MNTNTNTTTVEVSTAKQAGQTGIITNLTIDWSDMTHEDIRALAQQALIVKLQSAWSRNSIPEGDHTVKASAYKVGVRGPRTKMTLEEMIKSLSAEERAALLQRIAG